MKLIEVEVENLDELNEEMESQADIAMLDNFNTHDVLKASEMEQGKIKIEVSGNIDKEQIAKLKNLNIDYISSGDLTKNIAAIDYSLIFKSLD